MLGSGKKSALAFFFGLLLGLVLLPVIVGLWLMWIVQYDTQQNWLKMQLASAFHQYTGLQLSLPQALQLELTPTPQLSTPAVSVTGAEQALVSAEGVAITPDFISQALGIEFSLKTLLFKHGRLKDFQSSLQVDQQNQLSAQGSSKLEQWQPIALVNELVQTFDLSAVTPLPDSSQVLQSLDGSVTWEISPLLVKISAFALQLDQSHWRGDVIYNLQSGRLNLNLHIDQLQLDEYLRYAESFASEPPKPSDKEPLQQALDTLQGLNAEGRITIDRLTYQDKTLEKVDLVFGDK